MIYITLQRRKNLREGGGWGEREKGKKKERDRGAKTKDKKLIK